MPQRRVWNLWLGPASRIASNLKQSLTRHSQWIAMPAPQTKTGPIFIGPAKNLYPKTRRGLRDLGGLANRSRNIGSFGQRDHQMVEIELVAGTHRLRGHVTAIVRVDRGMQRLASDNVDAEPAQTVEL